MSVPVVAKVKIAGSYAEKVRVEAARRRMSMAALITEYAMRGIDSEVTDESALAGFERRIAATILASRSDMEALQAEVDTLVAMNDTLAKSLFLHLPEPATEREATIASAQTRYERYIQQTANAFDGDRPRALKKIAALIQKRIETAEGNQ